MYIINYDGYIADSYWLWIHRKLQWIHCIIWCIHCIWYKFFIRGIHRSKFKYIASLHNPNYFQIHRFALFRSQKSPHRLGLTNTHTSGCSCRLSRARSNSIMFCFKIEFLDLSPSRFRSKFGRLRIPAGPKIDPLVIDEGTSEYGFFEASEYGSFDRSEYVFFETSEYGSFEISEYGFFEASEIGTCGKSE